MSKKKIPGLKLTPAYSNFSKDSTFKVLEKGILDIFSKSSDTKISFEELYRSCYLLVLNKHGSWLYSQIQNIINQELIKTRNVSASDILEIFQDFSLKLSLVRDVLMYLDRSFIPLHSMKSVYELGMERFKEIIVLENSDLIIKYFLLKVENSRNLQDVKDDQELKKITDMYFYFNIYFSVLETEFLKDSKEFYRNQKKSLSALGVSGYLEKVYKSIQEEETRVEKVMRKETKEKIIQLILEEMVEKEKVWIINVKSVLMKLG
jgi:cullin 3